MLDLFTSEPRVAIGAVVGFLIGLGCVYALQECFAVTPLIASLVATVGLVTGIVLGALWEARRS